jgi:hypothetical protein
MGASGDLKRLTQQEAAYVVDHNPTWMRERVSEIPRNADGTYDVKQLVKWFAGSEVAAALTSVGATGDPKIRKLNADAALQELKYKKLAGEVVPIHLLEPYFMEIAAVLKRTGEQVQKQYGSEAYDLYAEALEEVQRIGERTVDEATSQAKSEAESENDTADQ